MSDSPQSNPKDTDEGIQSPDEETQMNDSQDPHSALGHDIEVKEQDRWLPIANVARIMKHALPSNAKIAKEAKECMQECVSEFISFITSEASEKCQQEKRKTVNGEDIIFAMTSLGFENYAEALKIYLSKYREIVAQQTNRTDNQSGRPTSQGGYGAPTPAAAEAGPSNAASGAGGSTPFPGPDASTRQDAGNGEASYQLYSGPSGPPENY